MRRLRNAQKERINSHQNLSTLAALLSTVTATCLQMTYQRESGTLDIVVNALWMSSLAFSIFCSIWSQLACRWITSQFHAPRAEWVNTIIGNMPFTLLSASCVAFGGGLICLAYTFFPHTAIPPIVISLIAGLATTSAIVLFWWFVDGVLMHPYRKHKSFIFGGSSRMHRRTRESEAEGPTVSLRRRTSSDDLEKGEMSRPPSAIDLATQLPVTVEVSPPVRGSDAIFQIHSAPMAEAIAQPYSASSP